MANIIYKFLSVDNAIKDMEQHELKVTLIRELNDIFDCGPILVLSGANPRVVNLSSTDERSEPDLPIPDVSGLLCFSKNYSSPLLWGHYADGAKGIALGFDPDHFKSKTDIHVDYKEDRPVVEVRVGNDDTVSIMQKLLSHYFGTKALEWKYEDEVRYLLELEDCVPRTKMYFAEFPSRALREVIVGPRSSLRPSYLQHLLTAHYRGIGVSLHSAHLHSKRFEVEARPFPPDDPFVS